MRRRGPSRGTEQKRKESEIKRTELGGGKAMVGEWQYSHQNTKLVRN